MKINKSLWILGIIILTLSLAGCSNKDPNLSSQTWQLVSYGLVDNPNAAAPALSTSMTFDNTGTMNANMGCNSISGNYKVSSGHLTLSPLTSTMMACPGNGSEKQESAFISLFNGPVEYRINGRILTISSNNDQNVLVFSGK